MAGGVLSEAFPWQLAELRPGSLLAGYKLEAQVGAGGMATVFRARDERLGRLVALKVLAPALTADAAFRRRFMAESRAAATVDDPHIIPVYEAGEANGALFIAMRFVHGGDLRGVLEREGALAPARATAFISPVASALDAAHGAGLVHRDVKPANILVDARPGRPEHVYLSDFGVSKGAMSSVSLTAAGQFLGTPDYAAPEQVQGLVVDGRTDQYARACVAYQLLTGAVPFERDQGMAVLFAHLSQPPPSLVARRPDLPGAADKVLAKALAKAPEKRFESCRDFAEALREALGRPPYLPAGAGPAPGHPQPQVGSPPSWFAGSSAPTIDSGLVPPAAAIVTGATSPGREADKGTGTMPRVPSAARPEGRSPGLPASPIHAIRSGRPHMRQTTKWISVILAAGVVLTAAGLVIGTRLGTTPHPKADPTQGRSAHGTPAGTIPQGPTAYALAGNGILPVNLTTDTPGKPIAIGNNPGGIAITQDARTAYVTAGDSIVPVNLATGRPGTPINVGHSLSAIAITPDGKTAYVIDDSGVGTAIRVDLTTGKYGKPIKVDHLLSLPGGGTVGDGPITITITPDGKTAYTANYEAWTVTPIDVATGTRGTPIKVGQNPNSIAITPDGKTAYTANAGDSTVTPIDLATRTARAPIHFPDPPWSIAVTPDGKTAYVATFDGKLIPVDLATDTLGRPIGVASDPEIAIAPDGKVAYITGLFSSTITPIRLATSARETPIRIGQSPAEIVIVK
jgi:YVTN family beta-propeller protein